MDVGFTEIQGIATLILFGLVTWLVIEQKILQRKIHQRVSKNTDHSALQLQAYERLALLTERISLKNLIMRIPATGLNAIELQALLTETIRSEYEHNITQQIYVTPEIWKAITHFKEQNIYIIHQLATMMPSATGKDLSKAIVQYLENNNAELSKTILDAIQFEAKKIM